MKAIKILLVDDDLRNSMLLKRFIEAEGYEVIYANNGMVGLEMYREIRPDLILLDINMPELDGFEMARIIRQNDKRVIIFFLTDRTDKVDRLHGFSLKGNDYIPKPFYPEELMARINERFGSMTVNQDVEYHLGNTIFRPNLSSLTYEGETHSLSVRQTEILQILAENIGNLVERDVILDKIWGDISYSNSLALNVQITYLRRLLPDPALTITSIKKKGYILSVT
ncbi:MAG: response regulator transcription factor [Duncaniella sp.]|uniref:response regulator transcription factor n=1 Tax=Duncaniella sp. TaxID=2518496 RepID=UPI0023BD683E|nr:response regulator transcription factor [Duncaniella sp.]MDE6089832.1 response regulator transcription factor [Duncaniella sp.]